MPSSFPFAIAADCHPATNPSITMKSTLFQASSFAYALLPLLFCSVEGLSVPRPRITTTAAAPTQHHASRQVLHLLETTTTSTSLPNSAAIDTPSFLSMNILTRRRSILERASLSLLSSSSSLAILIGGSTPPAFAAGDAQFVEVGQQERPPNGETPFTTLSDGVQIKDFRVAGGGGGGSGVVRAGSRVELTMKGRLLNLNGVIFYDTKENDPNGFGEGSPLVFTVGSNTVLPGLESGIIGMTKGGIRRIIIPANVGYGAYPTLEPQPLSEMGKRALESVTKNPRRDQTVLFDVRVDRVR